jgi:hypothetical protein
MELSGRGACPSIGTQAPLAGSGRDDGCSVLVTTVMRLQPEAEAKGTRMKTLVWMGGVPEPSSGPVFLKWIALVILNNSISEDFARRHYCLFYSTGLSMDDILNHVTLTVG